MVLRSLVKCHPRMRFAPQFRKFPFKEFIVKSQVVDLPARSRLSSHT
jgi:hypothetical protein